MIDDPIHVKVVDRSDRRYIVYRWSRPATGENGERSARTSKRRQAFRKIPVFVERLRTELRAKEPASPPEVQRLTWEEACQRYEDEHLIKRRESTRAAWRKARNRFAGLVEPQFLEQLDTSGISRFEAALYGWLEPDSINSYLRSLRAFANWAARVFTDYSAPAFSIPRCKAGGRPLSVEEVKQMLSHCQPVVGEGNAGSWRFMIRGLVRSGLRLGQALQLSWESDAPVRVYDLDRRPKFFIDSESHKGRRTQRISLTPPMVALLRRVPHGRRVGYVFRPRLQKGVTRSLVTVSATICRIGEAAGIRVGTRMQRDSKTGKVKRVPKFASAHDLKRTFMQRLIALNVHPAIVAHYGQHQSFETTQHHYAEHDADRLGAIVNDAFRRRRKRASKR